MFYLRELLLPYVLLLLAPTPNLTPKIGLLTAVAISVLLLFLVQLVLCVVDPSTTGFLFASVYIVH